MKGLLSLILTLIITLAQAQYFDAGTYDWGKAQYETVTGQDSTDKYTIKLKYLFHYFYNEDDQLTEHYLYHKKYQVNSDDAIESSNRIYVSETEESGGLVTFKARVISPSGKVKELTKDDWLTGVDEESEEEYTYVALEGLEHGSQVEYYHIRSLEPNYSGVTVSPQGEVPVKSFELDIISPWNLEFAAKVYNMDTALSRDTTLENENRLFIHLDSIPGLKEEPTSFWETNLVRIVFKLDNNLYTGKRNLISYANTAQNVVNAMNVEWDRKEEKALKKIEKDIDIAENLASEKAIRAIENYLKENYQYIKFSHPNLTDISTIYENKAFNQLGALRIYSQLLKNRGIDFKLVYTCDRSETIFDGEFETTYPLDDLLLYFPEHEEFIDFTTPLHRFGCISPYHRGHHGLFIEEMELGENTVGVAAVKEIPAKGPKFTLDTLVINVNFGEDLFENSLDVRRVLTGYHAQYYQPLFELVIEEEDLTDIKESILNYVDSEAEIAEMAVKNGSADLLGIEPLVVSGRLESANFVEKAGTSFLFKVGNLIGPQQEMYQENEERMTDIETAFARAYMRTINFEIPEGYEIENLKDLEMDFSMEYNNETSARFVSSYTMDGNKVAVEIWEFYEEVKYPKEMFEEYRSVINAAADFNKVTLLMKKS